jgi:hypothetical protein
VGGKEENKAREAYETKKIVRTMHLNTSVEINALVDSEIRHTSKRRHVARHKSDHFLDTEEV